MNELLYRFVMFLYRLGAVVLSLGNGKAKKFVAGRKGLLNAIARAFENEQNPVVWFHCASLGEFEQGRNLMERFRELFPGYKILVTFFSPSGYESKKDYQGADYIFYLPFDTPRNAREFIKITKPKMAFFVKYEFWFFYLKILNQQQIPTFLVSGIFRKDQVFFRGYGGFYRTWLRFFTYFFVQDDTSKNLLEGAGLRNCTVAGDTRFDRVWQICQKSRALPIAENFKNNGQLMVIGSSWPEDMELLLPLINDPDIDLKYIIAPHEIEAGKIDKLEKQIRAKTIRYSKAGEKGTSDHKVLIIDNVGLLSSLYRYGEIAYIGGAFGEGLHNILEAATFGVPLFFGRSSSNAKYREAVELTSLGGAFEMGDADELELNIRAMLADEAKRKKAGKVASGYVRSNTGATETIVNFLKQMP